MTADQWITLVLGLAGCGTTAQLVKLYTDRRDGQARRRRSEVDSAAAIAAEERKARIAAEALEEDRARRERIALELLSATRRVALDHGVPLEALPPVDLGGR